MPEVDDPNLLVGVATRDDASVYKLNADTALVQTVDFFPPVVDDAYTYGAVSAANSLSDIYATGARPITAMNIVAFPDDLPLALLKEILRGGADKASEANVPIVGGHTIKDREPKYGLAVLGLVRPECALTNTGANPGDALVLTKPIGSGIITTAAKLDRADQRCLESAIGYMLALNQEASAVAVSMGANACTDVTGFGLLGHLSTMTQESGVGACVYNSAVPLMDGAADLATYHEVTPAGTQRNRQHYDKSVTLSGVDEVSLRLLFDPQTSGGLLLSVEPSQTDGLIQSLHDRGITEAAVIGKVTDGKPGEILVTH